MIEKKTFYKRNQAGQDQVVKVLRVGNKYIAYDSDKNTALTDKLMCLTAIEYFLEKNKYYDATRLIEEYQNG